MKKNILFILILIFSMSCKNCDETKDNEPIKQCDSLYVNTWFMIVRQYPYSSKLFIYDNYSFRYEFSSLSYGFSQGNWHVDSPFIVLNSFQIDTCMYFSRFGEECIPIDGFNDVDKVLKATTIDGCTPLTQISYVVFEKDSFYLSNDTMFYFNKNADKHCPIKHIYTTNK
jgi:hypothetical protein